MSMLKKCDCSMAVCKLMIQRVFTDATFYSLLAHFSNNLSVHVNRVFLSTSLAPRCVERITAGLVGTAAVRLRAWEQQPTSRSPTGQALARDGPQQ